MRPRFFRRPPPAGTAGFARTVGNHFLTDRPSARIGLRHGATRDIGTEISAETNSQARLDGYATQPLIPARSDHTATWSHLLRLGATAAPLLSTSRQDCDRTATWSDGSSAAVDIATELRLGATAAPLLSTSRPARDLERRQLRSRDDKGDRQQPPIYRIENDGPHQLFTYVRLMYYCIVIFLCRKITLRRRSRNLFRLQTPAICVTASPASPRHP